MALPSLLCPARRERRVSRDVAAFLPECAAKALRPMPERADVRWFRDVAPVGLQLPLVTVADSPLLLAHGRSCGCSDVKVNNQYFYMRVTGVGDIEARGSAPLPISRASASLEATS